jgi:predicted Zn-dependent peptidase
MKRLFVGLIGICCALIIAGPLKAGLTPKRSVLDNGVVLLTSEQKAVPVVSIELLIDASSR